MYIYIYIHIRPVSEETAQTVRVRTS